MAIFHLSIRPISRAKGHCADAQIGYDTRCKLTNERTGETHDWSKHKEDVIQWQIVGPKMAPGELAVRAEQAEKRWDARVARAMDVALPNELTTKAQWDLLRGFGLQLRDTYGAALCVSLHHPNANGDQRNVHGHIFMTSRAVDEEGNFSKRKIRQLDDHKLGPVEVERIREMWEVRCNRGPPQGRILGRRKPPVATSPGHRTSTNTAPRAQSDSNGTQWLPATEGGG